MKDALEAVVSAELDAIGFDLVELRRGGTRHRPLIEVRIDRRDGGAVTVDDCAVVSRALEARLDERGDAPALVAPQYVLQVSSPGERPLRTSADWRRFIGQWANVLSPEYGGRFEGKILAVEETNEVEALEVRKVVEIAVLELEHGVERRVPLAAVKEARLAFHL